MKSDITQDFIQSQILLDDLGFTRGYIPGFVWNYDSLEISLGLTDYHIYDNILNKNVIRPHIKLTYKYTNDNPVDVLITQNWESIRQSILSSSITDLGIKPLNRAIKLYCILNNLEYRESPKGSYSCMALKLNPKILL